MEEDTEQLSGYLSQYYETCKSVFGIIDTDIDQPNLIRTSLSSLISAIDGSRSIIQRMFGEKETATWFLHGLLKASTTPHLSNDKEFYVKMQTNILRAITSVNVGTFSRIIELYLEALQSGLLLPSYSNNLQFIHMEDNFEKHNLRLGRLNFKITNANEQINFCKTILQVLSSISYEILCYASSSYSFVWKLCRGIIVSSPRPLKVAVLPFLAYFVSYEGLPVKFDDTVPIFNSLPSLMNEIDKTTQDSVITVWNSLRSAFKCDPSALKQIFYKLLDVFNEVSLEKNMNCFIYREINQILTEIKDFNMVPSLFMEYKTIPVFDKILMLVQSTTSEISEFLKKEKKFGDTTYHGFIGCYPYVCIVSDASKTWRWLVSTYLRENDNQTALSQMQLIQALVQASCQIVGHLESQIFASKLKIEMNFFGENFLFILQEILKIIKGNNELTKMALQTTAKLLNLTEAQNFSQNNVKPFLNFLQKPGHISSEWELVILQLQCLQRLPLGLTQESALTLFSKSADKSNKDLMIQAVRGVPYLFLTGKVIASGLISNVLLPAAHSKIPAAHLALLVVVQELVCALAGTAYVTRSKDGELKITCCDCSNLKDPKGSQGDVNLVEAHLMIILSCCQSSPDIRVKKQFLSTLKKVSMHMSAFRRRDVNSNYLCYMSDKNDELREEFARTFPCLLFGRSWIVRSAHEYLKEDDLMYNNADPKGEIVLSSLDLFFTQLEENILRSLSSQDYFYMRDSLMETISNIGCVPVKAVLFNSIQLLLHYGVCPEIPISPVFFKITVAHSTSPTLLFSSCRPEISQFVANLIAINRLGLNHSLDCTLERVLTVFNGVSQSRFLQGCFTHTVPVLLVWITKFEELQDLIQDWAEVSHTSAPTIISKCFQNIYTHVLLTEPRDIFDKCMALVERLSNVSVATFITHCQKPLTNQLLFNFHRNPELVEKALKEVHNCSSQMELKEKLKTCFVGYLQFIVSKLTKDVNTDSHRVYAIRSLTAVLSMMGRKHVSAVSRKVLSTIQTTQSISSRQYFADQLRLWGVFIQLLEVSELGPLLVTFVVSLLPFLTYLPEEVAKILTYLIVENEANVDKFLPGLTFLPQHKVLKNISQVVKKYIDFEKETLKERLRRETAVILHETVGVRIEGLRAVYTTLKARFVDIHNFLVGCDEPDPCVTEMLQALVLCSCDTDTTIATTAALCLGQLGAVDPGLSPRKPKPYSELPLSIHDPEFVFLALTELARAFQTARNSVDMDAFAIAIQELLKLNNIKNEEDNKIWNRFPEHTRSLITPMLSSFYKVQIPKRDNWPDVIFGSTEAKTHLSWASIWASKLTGFCSDSRTVFVLRVCEPSLKRDTAIVLLFLRYTLLHAVLRGSSVHAAIIKEIEAVLSWTRQTSYNDETLLALKPCRPVQFCGYIDIRTTMTVAEAQSCVMTMHLLLDFLQYWQRLYLSTKCTANGDHLQDKNFILVKEFMEKIDYLKVASSNYEIREYSRSIMYLEDVITQNNSLLTNLPMLSKAYALHGDLDSVAGATTFQKAAPSIQDLILSHEVSGQMEEVRILYERLRKEGPMTPAHTQEMIQCYLTLGEPFTALNYVRSATMEQPHLMPMLSEAMSESLMKLGDYQELSTFLESKSSSRQEEWFSQLGKITLQFHKDTHDGVADLLAATRASVVDSLKVIGFQFGDYQKGYDGLLELQILNEVENVSEILKACRERTTDGMTERSVESLLRSTSEEWTSRLAVVQASPGCLEPILSMRRVLLQLVREKVPEELKGNVDSEIGKSWVKSAEVARKAKCFHQAYNYILNAEPFNIHSTFIEKAQLFWDKGDQDNCLSTLSRGIKEYFPDWETMKSLPPGQRYEERKMCAEAKLLYAVFSEETSNCDHNTNVINYKEAFDICRQLEKSEAFYAQCLDRVVSQMDPNEQNSKRACDLKMTMIHHFGASLTHSCEYIYQTVPRMLSIWLDMGEKQDTPEKVAAMSTMNKLIQQFLDRLPPFVFMTALPQLLSRLGHPCRDVFLMLKKILVTLIKAFPQQCLWAVQTVAKSSIPERVKRYNELIQDGELRSTNISKLISDFTVLCDKLNRLTNRNLPNDAAFRGLKVSSVVRELPQLFVSEKFSSIIIPITRFCAISLPRNVTSASHDPFPKHAVYIRGVADEMTVLPSLQRPRKISLLGTDGRTYDILCKPKDDLRRDGRLMEFNNIVNMYLHRDPDSRARGLHIRNYVVTPLGENGGLLEWVPNLVGLRPALLKLYKQYGKYTSTKEIKKFECQLRDTLEKKKNVFVEKLLPLHPPMLPQWFRLTFPEPAGWFIARQAYIRTTAVVSMVGYILGLGDRHGENILFDSETGDTVHVDFNCLFNKGEKFDWKERVPFRLTQNMVAAMGPVGVEGTFRKSCEISLRVLRSQNKTLMSVLTPFAYDPFGSWGKNREIVQNERDEKIKEALEELSDIEKRLNGSLRVKQKNTTPYLSVEGQVRSLIKEAVDIDNLCQMYLGWGAYL